jgi:hypothetical protein
MRFITSLVLAGILMSPNLVSALELGQGPTSFTNLVAVRQLPSAGLNASFARVLSDHPGAATALTAVQKQEIRSVVARSSGNSRLICTGVSLSGQRESMYRVVRLRAQLVCDFAKSLNPSLRTVVQEGFTPASQFNGRVVVVSR